ncbi:MAG TPA: DUF6067 family protein [Candidatus Hydrogenedens sp.]|nr:DUF6067 family protein [Candidatus Hydrogenedens sp.]
MLLDISLTIYFIISGTNIWVEPSWCSTNIEKPSNFSSYNATIFSAKGEEESFQIHIFSDSESLNDVSLQIERLPNELTPPQIYQILPVEGIPLPQGGLDRSAIFFDILKPIEPFNIYQRQKAVLWITFHIPKEIKSGHYQTEIILNSKGKKIRKIPVDIEVFDFEIPQTPSLPAISFLDWKTMAQLNNNNANSADDFWTSLFTFLYKKHLTLSLGMYLQTNNTENLSVPKNLWDKLIQSIKETDISISNTILDVTPLLLPSGPLDTVRSPTQEETKIWQQIKEDLPQSNLSVVLFCPPESEQNESLKRYLNALSEQTPSLIRILCSPPSPQFNFYTDIWAIPFNYFSIDLIQRLTRGISITDETNISIKSVSASSCGFLPGSYPPILSSPQNIADNCPFTGWLSLPAEKEGKNEWVEIHLKESHIGKNLVIIWGPGQTPQSAEVNTSRDGIHFFPSSITWKHITGRFFENSISYGTFKYNPDFIAFRLELKKLKKGETIFIQDVRLNLPEKIPEPRIAPIIKPWLWTIPEQYPSLRYDAPPIESRIIPWICWYYQLQGAILTPINSWNNVILKPADKKDFIPQPQNTLQMTSLLYPAPNNNYYSSVRLERLRDGMEDYEYLLLMAKKMQTEKLKNDDVYAWLSPNLEQYLPWNIVTDEFVNKLISTRITIGYELSGKTIPNKKTERQKNNIREKQPSPFMPRKVQKNFTGKKS